MKFWDVRCVRISSAINSISDPFYSKDWQILLRKGSKKNKSNEFLQHFWAVFSAHVSGQWDNGTCEKTTFGIPYPIPYPMSYILSKILSDILSDMLSDILSDSLSNMMDG